MVGGKRGNAIKLGPRFLRAFLFAAEKHAGQVRKASTTPYIAHLMGVASLALEYGGDEDMAIAALLHDVVEDCGGAPMLKEVKRRFGSRVAKIVDGCTDSDTRSEAAVARTQRNLYPAFEKCGCGHQAGFCRGQTAIMCARFFPITARLGNQSGHVSMAGARALFGTIGRC